MSPLNASVPSKLPAVNLRSLVPIFGKWTIDDAAAVFTGYEDEKWKVGIALTAIRCTAGHFECTVRLEDVKEANAQFVVGHDPESQSGYAIGLGGWGHAFSMSEYYIPRSGSKKLFGLGQWENLQANRDYRIALDLRAQNVRFELDGTRVFERILPRPLTGSQFGIKAHGDRPVAFSNLAASPSRPRAFVIMQFSEPYDSLWKEVIRPVADRAGYDAHRADDVFRPGIVLQDVVRGIVESEVIIAEVSPKNPNVFYELGYAHALGKPAVLLAEQPKDGPTPLPFDISGFRCIFYDDAIRGKSKVETTLEQHLRNIRHGENGAPADVSVES